MKLRFCYFTVVLQNGTLIIIIGDTFPISCQSGYYVKGLLQIKGKV